jgi:hypothetical protein
MENPKIYESYPWYIIFITSIVTLLVCLSGAYIMFRLHWITGVLYIIFLIIMEFHIYKEACPYCCYYGKFCAFGRGVVAKIFFKKGDPKKFCEKQITFKNFIPQMIGLGIPIIIGIILLISRGFHTLTLIAIIYPILSWFAINPIMYGKLACAHCKQGSICCPALEFFSKRKGVKNGK